MNPSVNQDHTRVSLRTVFLVFLGTGASAFGGGGMPLIFEATVQRHNLITEAEYLEASTLAQLLPGPNFTNLAAHIGYGLRGPLGAALAVLGVILPGSVCIVALSWAYFSGGALRHPLVVSALRFMTAAALGVIWAMTVRLVPKSVAVRGGVPLAVLACLGLVLLQQSVIVILLALLPLGLWFNRPEGT